MSTEMIVALAVAGLAVVYVLFSYARPSALPVVSRPAAPTAARPANPGRALIDFAEEAGKDAAGRILAEKLGENQAKQFVSSISSAFASPSPDVPK